MATKTKTKTKINVRPLHDKLLVERDEAETVTSAGIYLPESSTEKPQFATVLAVGDGTLNETTGQRTPLDIKVGDRVILSKWGGTELKLDGEEYLIVNASDVLAIVS
jgi:chaperonin GroES